MADTSLFASSEGKGGLAKGCPKGLAKGMMKGFGKGKGGTPKDDPPLLQDDATQLAVAINKVRKMRDMCGIMVSALQDSVQEAKKGKFWSKAAQKDVDKTMGKLEDQIQSLKKVLSKGGSTVDDMKECVLNAALVCKEVKDEIKGYKALAHKTSSVTSKTSKKK